MRKGARFGYYFAIHSDHIYCRAGTMANNKPCLWFTSVAGFPAASYVSTLSPKTYKLLEQDGRSSREKPASKIARELLAASIILGTNYARRSQPRLWHFCSAITRNDLAPVTCKMSPRIAPGIVSFNLFASRHNGPSPRYAKDSLLISLFIGPKI